MSHRKWSERKTRERRERMEARGEHILAGNGGGRIRECWCRDYHVRARVRNIPLGIVWAEHP